MAAKNFPMPADVTSNDTTNGQQKGYFEDWINASMQLPGGAPAQTYTVVSSSFTPMVADCILALAEGETTANLESASVAIMGAGRIMRLKTSSPDIAITIKHEASGLSGRFSTHSREDVALAADVWTTFKLTDGAWVEDLSMTPSGSGDGYALLDVKWSTTGLIDPGFLDISQNNGLLQRSAFPEAWDKIQQALAASTGAVVDEGTWQAFFVEHGFCPMFSTGDGAGTFRVPVFRTRFSVSPPDPDKGYIQSMEISDQIGPIEVFRDNRTTSASPNGMGDPRIESGFVGFIVNTNGDYKQTPGDTSTNVLVRGVSHGDITHGPLVIQTPMMKMYGAVSDAGTVTLAELVNAMTGKLDTAAFEMSQQIFHVQEQSPSGTTGGSFTAGAWRTRGLNTVLNNSVPGAALDTTSGKISLPAGTYWVSGYGSCYRAGINQTALADSGGAFLLLGSSERVYNSVYASSNSTIEGLVTLAATAELYLQHRCTETGSFGVDGSFNTNNVYASLAFRRIS